MERVEKVVARGSIADCDKFKFLRENSEVTFPLSLEEQEQGNIFFLFTRTNCSHCLNVKNKTTSPFQVPKCTGTIAQPAIALPYIFLTFQQVTGIMKSSPIASYFLYLLWDKSVLWLKCLSLFSAGQACPLCLNFYVVLYALEPSCVAVGRYRSSSTSDCVALRDGWRGWARAGKVAICQEKGQYSLGNESLAEIALRYLWVSTGRCHLRCWTNSFISSIPPHSFLV